MSKNLTAPSRQQKIASRGRDSQTHAISTTHMDCSRSLLSSRLSILHRKSFVALESKSYIRLGTQPKFYQSFSCKIFSSTK